MRVFEVIEAGLLTTVQDLGRIGYQSYGVPASGAMDNFACRIGNILVENAQNSAVLEVMAIGPVLGILSNTVISITGGDLQPCVNGMSVEMWRSVKVRRGDIISFKGIKSGMRSYISVRGGIDVPVLFGSRSTYLKGSMGGFKGRKLERGDIVEVFDIPSLDHVNRVPREFVPQYPACSHISAIPGPQEDHFGEGSLNRFFSSIYTVLQQSDRMGYRLEGAPIKYIGSPDIVTDGIALGSVQVPGNGQPIIMMSDHQTTGGYAKIATVITPHISLIAQMKPGDSIIFKKASVELAHRMLKQNEELIARIDRDKRANTRFFNIKVEGNIFSVRVDEIE